VLEPLIAPAGVYRTLTDSVTSQLRDLIIAGDIPPGTALRLRSVADQLGVSVMPVREALRVLEAERLVTVSPHRGATVMQISAHEVEEIYAMRGGLERLAARRAMERILPEEVLSLSRQFEAMAEAARADDLDRFSIEDRKFHRMLYEVAGRDSLRRKILDLTRSGSRAVKLAYGVWRPLVLGLEAHRPIMDSIEAGDPDRVAQLTYEHVTEGGARIHAAVARWEADRVLDGA
jgi:DNA-binding GntR family transcriptional regulator